MKKFLPILLLLLLMSAHVRAAHAQVSSGPEGSSANSYEPRWTPSHVRKNVPLEPEDRLRGGAVVGSLGGLLVSAATGYVVYAVTDEDLLALSAVGLSALATLPVASSVGVLVAGRGRAGLAGSTFTWSVGLALLTSGVCTGLGAALASGGEPEAGPLLGLTLGTVANVIIAPLGALAGFRRSERRATDAKRFAIVPRASADGRARTAYLALRLSL